MKKILLLVLLSIVSIGCSTKEIIQKEVRTPQQVDAKLERAEVPSCNVDIRGAKISDSFYTALYNKGYNLINSEAERKITTNGSVLVSDATGFEYGYVFYIDFVKLVNGRKVILAQATGKKAPLITNYDTDYKWSGIAQDKAEKEIIKEINPCQK